MLWRSGNVATSPLRERYRNNLGAALFEPIDEGLSGYSAERIDRLMESLMRARAERERWTQQAIANSYYGGIGATGLSGE